MPVGLCCRVPKSEHALPIAARNFRKISESLPRLAALEKQNPWNLKKSSAALWLFIPKWGCVGSFEGSAIVDSRSPHVDLLPTSIRLSLFGNDPTSMGRGLSKIVSGVASKSCRHRFQLRSRSGSWLTYPGTQTCVHGPRAQIQDKEILTTGVLTILIMITISVIIITPTTIVATTHHERRHPDAGVTTTNIHIISSIYFFGAAQTACIITQTRHRCTESRS